jgi:catechol 2,3-dioxygenase-like lactoylglutathione lyase family enzyme
MKNLVAILGLAVLALLPLGHASAQAKPGAMVAPGDAVMGHVHLLVSDIDANKKFWVEMGGTPLTLGSGATAIEGVTFGSVRILLRKGDNIGPAVGSTINHIGFYVPNVKAAMAKWKDMGLKTEAGRNDQQGYVWTPSDLIRVEILEMPGQTAPIVFHHVHMYVTANAAGGEPEVQAWYAKMFGATTGKRGAFDTDNVPGAEITLTKSDTPTVPSAGRAVDHIGFNVKNLEAYCKKLEASGMKLDTAYMKRPDVGLAVAFITDPWGTRIELNEPLTQTSELR